MRISSIFICLLFVTGAMAQAPKKAAPKKASSKGPAYVTVSNTLKYRIVKSTAKIRVLHTDMSVMFNTNYRISILSNDSVLAETFTKNQPAFIPINEPSTSKALAHIMAGDSVEMILNADSFFNNSFRQPRPPFVKEGDKIRFIIKVSEILTQEQIKQKQKKEAAEAMVKDSIAMSATLKELNATSKTAEGVYYAELKKGNGTPVKKGDAVKVLYKGKLLNGQIFDQNLDSGIEVTVGNGNVIQGWESMLMNMEYGQKVVAVIPSSLAYGERGQSSIPPNSTLIFEMEIVAK